MRDEDRGDQAEGVAGGRRAAVILVLLALQVLLLVGLPRTQGWPFALGVLLLLGCAIATSLCALSLPRR